jgi:hypothetical protein
MRTASATVAGCSGDPLQPIELKSDLINTTAEANDEDRAGADAAAASDPSQDDAADATNGPDEALPSEPGNDVIIANGDNTPDPLVCSSGADGTSYRDTLPALPTAVAIPSTLAGGDGVAVAACAGEGVLQTRADNYWDNVASQHGHVRGQYYFEADVRSVVDGRVTVGVFASPASAFYMDWPFLDELSAAGATVDAPGIVSVAVDLDAGVVGLYLDGVLQSARTLAVLPGVGAYVAAVDSGGSVTALNLGSEPFTYAVPAGYAAWQTNDDGAAGACVTAQVPAVSVANASVLCGSINECGSSLTSFESDADAETQLVVLGAYDTDSQANWTWGTDENGNPIEVPVEGGRTGAARVELDRPGRIALVLSAYEPTAWSLDVGPDTDLVSASVYGFHAATVSGVPEGVPVDVQSICVDTNGGGNCDGATGASFPVAPYQWPYDVGGGDTQGFVRHVEEQLCLPLKVFVGAYNTRGFHVE